MTTEQLIQKIKGQIKDLKQGKPLALAVASVHSMQVKRIFEEGKKSTDSKIGNYNESTSLYVNPNNSPKKFPTKGKEGKSKFKNGNSHKTGFFKSYKEFRSKIGRQISFVDLKLSGQLQKDYSNSLQRSGTGWVSGLKNKANVGKVEGAEDKYGSIFNLTNKEKKELRRILKEETLKILNAY